MTDAASSDPICVERPSGRLLAHEVTSLALAGALLSTCFALALIASSGALHEHVHAPWTWRANPNLALQYLVSGPLFGALCGLVSWATLAGRARHAPLVGVVGACALAEGTIVLSHTIGHADPSGPLAGFIGFWSGHATDALFYLRYAPSVWWSVCALGALVHARAAGRSTAVQACAALAGGVLASCLLDDDGMRELFEGGRRGVLYFSLAVGVGLAPALWPSQRVARALWSGADIDGAATRPTFVREARLEAAALLPFAALIVATSALLRHPTLVLAGVAQGKLTPYTDVVSTSLRSALLVVTVTCAASRWSAGARPCAPALRGLLAAGGVLAGLALLHPWEVLTQPSIAYLALVLLAASLTITLLPSSSAERWRAISAGLGASTGAVAGLHLVTATPLLDDAHLHDAGAVLPVACALGGGLAGACVAAAWRAVAAIRAAGRRAPSSPAPRPAP